MPTPTPSGRQTRPDLSRWIFECAEHPKREPTVICWNCSKPISVDYIRSVDGRGKGVIAKRVRR